MRKRDAQRKMWQAVKAFVKDEDYESTMDDLSVVLNDTYWYQLEDWITIARDVLAMPEVKDNRAAPLPLIRRELERKALV